MKKIFKNLFSQLTKHRQIFNLTSRRVTVSALWMTWLQDYRKIKHWTDKRALERRMALGEKYVFPFIGNKHPKNITTIDIVSCLEFCANQTTQTQSKLLTALHQFLSWCDSKNYRNSKERLPTDKELLEPYLGVRLHNTQRNHYPAIDWREVPRFINSITSSKSTSVSKKILLFSILTVSRSQSVRLAKWNEINFELSEWNIPASHMKGKQGNNRPHNVPLSKEALTLLIELNKNQKVDPDKEIFSRNSSPISGNDKKKTIRSLNKQMANLGQATFTDPFQNNRDIVPHGFRAAFTTWAQENNKNMMLVEKCLAHKDPNDRHNGAYRRGEFVEQRRVLLQEWADFCFSEIQKK